MTILFDEAEARGKARGEAIGEARGEAIGEARGKARGEAIGEARGENRLASLMQKLFALGRNDDAQRAASDREFRKALFREFNIQ